MDDGTHWSDTRLLKQRAYFQFLPSTPWHNKQQKVFTSGGPISDHNSGANSFSPSLTMSSTSYSSFMASPSASNNNMGAQLELYPVEDGDQAIYRCRVDFLLSPTKNTIINFTVISKYKEITLTPSSIVFYISAVSYYSAFVILIDVTARRTIQAKQRPFINIARDFILS